MNSETINDSGPDSENSYPLPDNERKRLQVLESYDILDSNPEQDFDHLTDVACRFFDVPIALVSLIDDERQWFKSCVGLETRETDRSIAFCNYAISEPDLLIVEDTTEDDRFRDNPLVTGEEHIRFYAGIPLVNDEGYALGTFCILDREPRTLDDEQIEMLEIFGSETMAQLEKRRKRKQLEEALEEKQLLYDELHHRVKNNLQVIQSLLRMQSRQFEDEEFKRTLKRTEDRVGSLAMVHEQIQDMFEGDDEVRAEKYIHDLLQSIIPGGGMENVTLNIDVEEFRLSQDLIGQVGLILNELVHNSIEHGIPDDDEGTITVKTRSDGATVTLTVIDDGRGFPENGAGEGLGTTLVDSLVQNRLDGTIERTNDENGGAMVKITFPASEV